MPDGETSRLTKSEFSDQVTDAYHHLYDLVYLRTHTLTNTLFGDESLRRKEKAWRLHSALLDVIEELNPGPNASVVSREWRRYQLMVLRYVDSLETRAVSDHLAISRRHFYREHGVAIDRICSILWDRYVAKQISTHNLDTSLDEEQKSDRLELMRLEAARATQSKRYDRVSDVIRGVRPLLQDMLRHRDLDLSVEFNEPLPRVAIDRRLLRQLLLGILGFLIENADHATIQLTANVKPEVIALRARTSPWTAAHPVLGGSLDEQLSGIEEMALLCGAQALPIRREQAIIAFELRLQCASLHTLLVVDDNEDIIELIQRYLLESDYRVVGAQTAQDALRVTTRLQPFAIILDLMMPDQDGWDLMQLLLNLPDTQHIPIIVCSVLKQKELALSLGAAAFLEKPFSHDRLLAALGALTAP